MKPLWVQTDEKRAEVLQARVEGKRATVEEIIEFARIVSRLALMQAKPSASEDRACEILREGLRSFPDEPDLLHDLARRIRMTSERGVQHLLRKAMRAYESRADFDSVDSVAIDLSDDLFSDGCEALDAGNDMRAESFFRRAIRIHPFHADAWGHLGIIHEGRGNRIEAGRCYWRALQFGRIWCHQIELNNRRVAKLARAARLAITQYWAELHTRPYLRALYNWAQLLYRRKKFQSALVYAKESLLVNPNDNTGARYLAYSILRLLGNKSEMKRLARQYRSESLAQKADELEVLYFGSRIGQPRKRAKPN